MARLLEASRNDMIKYAKDVFFAYQSIDMLKNYSPGGQRTLEKQLTDIAAVPLPEIVGNEVPVNLQLGGGVVAVAQFKQNPDKQGEFIITFDPEIPTKTPLVKDLADYRGADLKTMLAGKTWKMEKDQKGEWKFASNVKGKDNLDYEIGGPSKVDLYKLHIANLKKFIDHLASQRKWYHIFSDDKYQQNAEINMTTGSGKSFTLALQALVEGLAGVKGVITVPNETLRTQLLGDFKKLLPGNFMDKFVGGKDNIVGDAQKEIIVGTTQDLLADPVKFAELKQVLRDTGGNLVVQHDEAHLLVANERTYRAAQELAKDHKNIYSTATPTKALHSIITRPFDTIASMTKEEKIKQGYAVPSAEHQVVTKSREQMDSESGRSVSWKEWMYRKVAILIDIKAPDNIMAAYGESLYVVNGKDNYKNAVIPGNGDKEKLLNLARWDVQLPSFEKSITYVGNFEDAVNVAKVNQTMIGRTYLIHDDPIVRMFKSGEGNHRDLDANPEPLVPAPAQDIEPFHPLGNKGEFYHNKASFDMNIIYKAVSMGGDINPDLNTYQSYQKGLNEKYLKEIEIKLIKRAKEHGINVSGNPELKLEVQMIAKRMAQGLRHAPVVTTMHNNIDMALAIIAGFSATEAEQHNRLDVIMNKYGRAGYLDERRFHDLGALTGELSVSARAMLGDGEMRNKLITLLTYNRDTNPIGIDKDSAVALADIVLDTTKIMALADDLIGQEGLKNKGRIVNNWHADQGVFKQYYWGLGLTGENELEGANKMVVFAKKNCQQLWFDKTLEQNEGIIADKVFTGFSEQRKNKLRDQDYQPKVRSGKRAIEALNPFNADTLEEPQYVAGANYSSEIAKNKLKLGIASESISNDPSILTGFNNPDLQNLRCIISDKNDKLNDPSARKQFEGRLRGKNAMMTPNYLCIVKEGVELYEDEREYKAASIEKTGRDLGIKITEYIEQNSTLTHGINDNALSNTVMNMLFDTFEGLGKQDAFDLRATEKDFVTAVNHAMNYMAAEQDKIKNGTQLGLFIRVVGALLYFVASIARYMESREALSALYGKVDVLEVTNNEVIAATRNILNLFPAEGGVDPQSVGGLELQRQIDGMQKDIEIAKIYRKCIKDTSVIDVLTNAAKQTMYVGTASEVMLKVKQEGGLDSKKIMGKIVERDPMLLFGEAGRNAVDIVRNPQAPNPDVGRIIKGIISLNALNANKVDIFAGGQVNPQELLASIANQQYQRNDAIVGEERNMPLENVRGLLIAISTWPATKLKYQNWSLEQVDQSMEGNRLQNGHDFKGLAGYIGVKMAANAGATPHLQTASVENLKPAFATEMSAKLKDIAQRVCHGFISNPEYIGSLKYPFKVFNDADLKLILGGDAAVLELKAYVNDVEDLNNGRMAKDEFYRKYCVLDLANADIIRENFKLTKVMENAVKVMGVINDANKEFYSIEEIGQNQPDKNALWRDQINGPNSGIYAAHIDDGQQAWRPITMLQQLKNMLPAINDIQFQKGAPEMNKSKEVAEKIMQNIVNRSNIVNPGEDAMLKVAKSFTEELRAERSKGANLNYDQLAEHEKGSRAEGMRKKVGVTTGWVVE